VTRQNQDGSESAYSYPPNSPLHSRTLTVDSDADSQYSALDSTAFSYGPKRTFQTDWKGYFSRDNAKNAIKVLGGPINRIEERLRINDMKSESKEKQAYRVSASIFDEVDEIVFGYLKDTYFKSFRHSFWWTRYHEFQCLAKKRVASADFSTLKVLGKGGFGTVNACKRRTTGKEYAMKKLIKKSVKMKKAEAHCMQERRILALIHSPFVVCLKYAYATPTDLYLILDLMNCGDLGFHLSRKGRFSESESKYYAARTLLGLAAMHELDIVHRDIKPENILMDKEGYTKISDLGLACKVGKKGLSGTCGTRGYWAPEMLGKKGKCKRPVYTISVDWFSFGCCLYEFLNGTSPFRTDKGRKWGKFPKIEKADIDRNTDLATQQMEPEYCKLVFTPIAIDLISKLLIKDGKSRLGANGHAEVAAHPWFAGKAHRTTHTLHMMHYT
jgi:beta-adrenergic-receptor kinase